MRIGLVIYGTLDTISGGFLYDRKLVEHLRQSGDHVEIISLEWRSYLTNLADNWSSAVRSRLRESALDLMLQDELNHSSLFRTNERLDDFPIVSVVHHLRSSERRPGWQNRLYRWVERRYLKSVDGFVFNSETTRAAVEVLVGGSPPSVVAYPSGDHLRPGVTPAQVEARAMAQGPLRVVFVGNIIPRKELHVLIAALARLPREEFSLEAVGSHSVDPGYVRTVHRKISEANLDGAVTLPGSITDEALVERLGQSHVLVMPSSYEGFGIAYLEGMGAGLPAIASTAGASAEVIDHDRNGFLIAPGDVDALARHLSELSRDREKLVRMGTAALDTYAAHPTWRETASRIRRFLCTIVS